MTCRELTEYLAACELFAGMTEKETEELICRGAGSVRNYAAGEQIAGPGAPRVPVTCVLSGCVAVSRVYMDQTTVVYNRIGAGEVLGLTSLADSGAWQAGEEAPPQGETRQQMQQYVAESDTMLYRMEMSCFRDGRHISDGIYRKLTGNLNRILSRELAAQYKRQEIFLAGSIRNKLMVYLQEEACRAGQREFDIPLNRIQLAEHLRTNRSALSREIGKMMREGLIDASGRRFVIKRQVQMSGDPV